MQLIDSIRADAPDMAAIRRDLHAHPELGFEELRTSDIVAARLTEWGIPIHRGLGRTGVVGILQNGTSTRAIGLRADMDALPMTEHNEFAHRSVVPGRMHACGHDGHTTMLLAAARHLAAHRNFDGTVYLIFQPAEEGGGGAREMVADGLFERFPMQAIFGAHNWPGLEVGVIGVNPGAMAASSNEFHITLRGKGSHAAMPNLGVDPVPLACQLVLAFQTIVTRNLRPIDPAVISVTMIHAGEATNVVPDSVTLQGTVRTFSSAVLDTIETRMRELTEHSALAYGATCEFSFKRNYPPTVNHPAESEFVRTTLAGVVGAERVIHFEPTMGAEDFSYFLLEKPGCYFIIGNGQGDHRHAGHGLGPCMLHNPSYDFNDALIPLGATCWVRLVEAWLG
ncbi:hydrolase [Deltaproteobacteria bacterium]|nr:hydrolase [Deltaproteobacteria bacterium]